MEAKSNPIFLRRLLAILTLAIFMTCFLMDTIECEKHKVPSWKKHPRHHIPFVKKHSMHHIPTLKKHPWHHIPVVKKHSVHHISIVKKHSIHHLSTMKKHPLHHISTVKKHPIHHIPIVKKHLGHHITPIKKHLGHHIPPTPMRKHLGHHIALMKKHLGHHIPSTKKLKSKAKGIVPQVSTLNPTRMPILPKAATFYSSWKNAFATFYGDETASETMGGACGYGNLYNSGYGTDTTALSSTLFNNGYGCGGCYEIRCVTSPHCYVGKSIRVTATNLCPANPKRPTNNGGWCNPPRVHFDMSKPAFMKLAWWRSGIVPVVYRRVSCVKKGGISFTITGNNWWSLIFITNVGGPGDISKVSIKGSKTGWIPMSRNWGASFQVFKNLKGQSLSFSVTSYTTKKTVIAWNVAPPTWTTGKTYYSIVQL